MGKSIGNCKESFKSEEYLTEEYQGRQHKIRDGVGGGWELSMGSGNKIETRGRILTAEDQGG